MPSAQLSNGGTVVKIWLKIWLEILDLHGWVVIIPLLLF
jgi:hypothetical protein